jgi:hypothetical protein
VSAWVSWYLYDSTDVPGLGPALAIASPVGSIAAALLNGTFAYGEASVAAWQDERKERSTKRKPTQADVSLTQADVSLTSLTCWCGVSLRNRYALASHSRKHLNEIASANDVASARATLQALYPDNSVPSMAEVAAMRRKVQEKSNE